MYVSELTCPECRSVVHGKFVAEGLSCLSESQAEFVRTFILCRGNIKEVEKRIGVSYPTVRNKLNDVIDALSQAQAATRSSILDALEAGEITSARAVEMLNTLQ